MTLLTARARAYVYAGQWVADCPRLCGNTEYLFLGDWRTERKPAFHCSYCHHVADIDWAPDEAAIMEVLSRRPIPHTRNWYPKGHDVAIRSGIPHGQTVAELCDENTEHGVA